MANACCTIDGRLGAAAVRNRSLAAALASDSPEIRDQPGGREETQAAALRTSVLAAREAAGKIWLFTLGPRGGATRGGSKVAEIGPVPPISAPEYLLRINRAGGPPGAKTPAHTHPGSEAFYVLTGRVGQKTPHGVSHAGAGQAMNGHGADTPMEVFSSGTTDLDQLVMFVVDATRPFSSPAKFD
jgi:hypothetical protein